MWTWTENYRKPLRHSPRAWVEPCWEEDVDDRIVWKCEVGLTLTRHPETVKVSNGFWFWRDRASNAKDQCKDDIKILFGSKPVHWHKLRPILFMSAWLCSLNWYIITNRSVRQHMWREFRKWLSKYWDFKELEHTHWSNIFIFVNGELTSVVWTQFNKKWNYKCKFWHVQVK